MNSTRCALALLTLALLPACSVIVETELENKGGSQDSGPDTGPIGPACDNTQQCLMFDERKFDCAQACIDGRCVAGPTPDGTLCGGTGAMQNCVDARCVTRECGDSYTDRRGASPEFCDDGNDAEMDGCTSMCTRSCVPPAPANCSDGNVCNGEESCTSGFCRATSQAADGTACMVGTDPGSCQAGRCVAD